MKNYAFIKDNTVVNVAVFEDDVTEETLDFFKLEHNVDLIILSDENTVMGGAYIDNQFRPHQPFQSWNWDKEDKKWAAPVPMPMPTEEYFYIWNEEIQNWMAISAPNEEHLVE